MLATLSPKSKAKDLLGLALMTARLIEKSRKSSLIGHD